MLCAQNAQAIELAGEEVIVAVHKRQESIITS
jgi:hypothetical protein